MLECLHLRPELWAFEASLRERAEVLQGLDDERFVRIRGIERDAHGLVVVSELMPGQRLADVIDTARMENGAAFGIDAALGFLLQALPALSALHALAMAHGSLAPGRLIVTNAGQLVVADAIYGAALDRSAPEPVRAVDGAGAGGAVGRGPDTSRPRRRHRAGVARGSRARHRPHRGRRPSRRAQRRLSRDRRARRDPLRQRVRVLGRAVLRRDSAAARAPADHRQRRCGVGGAPAGVAHRRRALPYGVRRTHALRTGSSQNRDQAPGAGVADAGAGPRGGAGRTATRGERSPPGPSRARHPLPCSRSPFTPRRCPRPCLRRCLSSSPRRTDPFERGSRAAYRHPSSSPPSAHCPSSIGRSSPSRRGCR